MAEWPRPRPRVVRGARRTLRATSHRRRTTVDETAQAPAPITKSFPLERYWWPSCAHFLFFSRLKLLCLLHLSSVSSRNLSYCKCLDRHLWAEQAQLGA
jgi:hypothetical protein